MPTIITRDYRPQDAAAARAVLQAAVRITGRKFYPHPQIQSWLSTGPSVCALQQRLAPSLACRVAYDTQGIYAFANITQAGHVDFIMCHPRRAHQGVGRILLAELMVRAKAHSIACLTTQASLAARPLFEAFGFVVEEPREVMGLACFGMISRLTP